MSHSHEGVTHSHEGGFNAQEHGHSHEILDGPGSYLGREMPIVEGRDWSERAFTIGIGGYVLRPPTVFCSSTDSSFPLLAPSAPARQPSCWPSASPSATASPSPP